MQNKISYSRALCTTKRIYMLAQYLLYNLQNGYANDVSPGMYDPSHKI